MVRDSAQIILHQRFRTWLLLAMVALIGAALVVSTDDSGAQTSVTVFKTDTSITLSWSAEGKLALYWWQPGPRELEKIEFNGEKSWTATGLQPESVHEFSFNGAFYDSFTVTTNAAGNPQPTPVVSIAAGANISEGGDATFALTATPKPTQTIDVKVSPLLAGDYGIPSAIKTISVPTSGTATFTFTTTDDSVDESDGSVTASIVSGTGYTSSTTNGSATVAIADNDVPELSIASDGDVTEGTAASFTITASPTPHTALSVDVGVSASGSFGVTTGTQTITVPTSGSKTFSVSTSGDSTDEPDGSVTVLLGSGTGYDVSSSADSATAAIADDDATPDPTPKQQQANPEVSITAGSAITEGSNATFTISVSPTQSATLDVSVTVSQTGAYASTGQQTVTIPTSGSYPLTVSTTNDSTDEPDGSIVATLDSGTGYTVSSSNGHATVAVSDDDDPPQPKAQQQTPQEQIQHCLTGNILNTVQGYYDANKNKGPHFGKNWKRVLITFRDVHDENLTPYTAAEAQQSENIWFGWKPVRVAIQCIEIIFPAPSADPEISIAGSSDVTEGSSVSFTVTATPAPSASLDVSVSVTQSGSFTTQTGTETVTIGATGSTSFAISTDNDTTDEPDGSVTATVDTGTGYTVSSSAGAATVNVADDDDAPDKQQNATPTITIADASEAEGDSLTFTVSVSPTHSSAITLAYETVDGTAISHADVDDYTTASGTVTIPAGDSSATITISTTEDSDIEINDEFTVVISNPPTGVTIDDDTATGTITNDDSGSVGAGYTTYSHKLLLLIEPNASNTSVGLFENGNARGVKYRLRRKPPHAVTFRPVVADARDGRSLKVTPEYLVFTPSNWSTEQTLSVQHIGNWGVHNITAIVKFHVVEYPGNTDSTGLLVSMYDASRTSPITQIKPDPNVLTEGDANSSLTYQVKLGAVPRDPITVTITNPDPGAVTVSPMSFVFDHTNYDELQDITITPVADGNSDDEDVEITVTIPVPHTNNPSPLTTTFNVVVEEPPSPGVRVDPQALTLDEGDSGQYDVWVRTDPGNGKSVIVTPTFTGSDITVSPTTLTFTGGSTGNWQTKQGVTVTSVKDADVDSENIAISHAISGDGNGYSAQSPSQSVAVSVLDDGGKVEIEFDRNNNLVLDEGNAAGVDIRVRLSNDPGAAGGSNNQVVMTTHPTGTYLVADPTTLTFTTGPTGNWNDWQTLTIKAASGKLDDGNTTHDRHWVKVALGMSPHQLQNLPGYPDTVNDVVARPIDIFYFDDEVTNDLHLEHTALTLVEGGSAVKYKLTLGGDPGGPVTVTITNPDPTKLTVSPTTVTFPYGGQGDWHIQEVTLTPLDDSDPWDHALQVVHDYNGYANAQQTLNVTIDDDDQGMVLTLSSSAVKIDELSSGSYDINLASDPGDGVSVVVTPVSGDTTKLTVSGALTFTGGASGDWADPQTVTLNAPIDDNYSNNKVTVTHTVSGLGGMVSAPDVTVTIVDAPPIYMTWTEDPTDTIEPGDLLQLTEGVQSVFYVQFDPERLAESTFRTEWFAAMKYSPNRKWVDDGPYPNFAIAVYFPTGAGNSRQWAFLSIWGGEPCDGGQPLKSPSGKYCQRIRVTPKVDKDANDITGNITSRVTGLPGYKNGIFPRPIYPTKLKVHVTDTNQQLDAQVGPTSVFLVEDLATADVWVRLKRKPDTEITVKPEIAAANAGEINVVPSSLSFDATNWNEFQKFTVFSLDDADTAHESFSFKLTGSGTSSSKIYFPDVPIDVTIIDDD